LVSVEVCFTLPRILIIITTYPFINGPNLASPDFFLPLLPNRILVAF
jgi:hypothetical protein